MTPWLVRPRPRPGARLGLYCLPSAGGGAGLFRAWPPLLPDDVEVCAVQLPGRDARRAEPPFTRLTPLVLALADALASELDRPYALYGHSVGARIAFELAREQRRRGRPGPELLVVSGRRPPHTPDRDPLHSLGDQQLIARLSRIGGTPEPVLREPELMALFLPTVRADLAVNELEDHRDEPPLACPILAYAGSHDDRCRPDELDAWRDHTAGAFAREVLPGAHFFIQSAAPALLSSLSRALRSSAPAKG